MEIRSSKSGSVSITIEVLEKYFRAEPFNSHMRLKKEYASLKMVSGKIHDLKIYPVMDKDNCDDELFGTYKSGEMFGDSPFKDNIIPIYSVQSLDEILIASGYEIDVKNKRRSYEKMFPGETGDKEAFDKLISSIPRTLDTNIHTLLEHCLRESPLFRK